VRSGRMFVMGSAGMGELKRAAGRLGVISIVLRGQGWKAASPAQVQAIERDPSEWLLAARERRQAKLAARARARERKRTAARFGVQLRVVKEHDILPGQVAGLLAAWPGWLLAERACRETRLQWEAKDRLCRELADALVLSVRDAWFQELERAAGEAQADAIDARWAPEVKRARREARELVDELTEGQVRARIGREEAAMDAAVVYRAGQLAR